MRSLKIVGAVHQEIDSSGMHAVLYRLLQPLWIVGSGIHCNDLHSGSQFGGVRRSSCEHVNDGSIFFDNEANGVTLVGLFFPFIASLEHFIWLICVGQLPSTRFDASHRSARRKRIEALPPERSPIERTNLIQVGHHLVEGVCLDRWCAGLSAMKKMTEVVE